MQAAEQHGLFISFEGGEGSGKSTQITYLKEQFERNGYDVVVTREPGGTPGGEEIRQLLVEGDPHRWSSTTEALLNYAARDQHLREVIRPALNAGQIVICDRFLDSTRVYQGIAGGCDEEFINALEYFIISDTRPDLTFILDIDEEIGLRRAGARDDKGEDRFERKSSIYHRKVREGFVQLARNEPRRCYLLSASGHPDALAEQIWSVVCERTYAGEDIDGA